MGNQYSNEDKKISKVNKIKEVLSPLSPKKKMRTKTPKSSRPSNPSSSLSYPTSSTQSQTPSQAPNNLSTNPFSKVNSQRKISNQWLTSTPARENYRFKDFIIDHTKILGEGAFAAVKLGFHIPTNTQVAVKIITKSKIPSEMKEYSINEQSFLAKLSHKNIINLYLTHEDEEYIYLFLEFVKSGDLYSLVESKGQLSSSLAKSILKQLVSALLYCHQNNTCHRDIKLENVLVDFDQSNELNTVVKLIDFGFASDIPYEKYKFQDFPGSMLYAAPELLSGTPYNARISDVYSLGVLFYIMLYGKYPFFSENNAELFYFISTHKPDFDAPVDPLAADLICKMLNPNPNLRITLDEILAHPYMIMRNDVREKKDVLSPFKTKVNKFKCEVEKHSQNLKRLSLSPKTSRNNRG